jgi:hypothetical protein
LLPVLSTYEASKFHLPEREQATDSALMPDPLP